MNSNEILCAAILLTEQRLRKIPDLDIYQSILRQLHYLFSIVDGTETNKSKLDKIILGHIAVREIEESDPELSNVLKKCQNIAFELELTDPCKNLTS